jgi:Cu-Zn family superoxide dismutase
MRRTALIALATACSLVACAQVTSLVKSAPTATASLLPTKGSQVQGSVKLVQRDGEVVVSGKVTGLSPGPHGFHVHEKGDCSAPDGASAGPHFDPSGSKAHGGRTGDKRHGGDLGNISADAKGIASFEIRVMGISLGSDLASVVGRSLIVHAKPDDLSTQPSGSSGPRLACGLISRAP